MSHRTLLSVATQPQRKPGLDYAQTEVLREGALVDSQALTRAAVFPELAPWP
jgi:hypothetical protein